MASWEYCVYGQQNNKIRYTSSSSYGSQYPDEGDNWKESIERLGQAGWELVTYSDEFWYFKRQVDEW